MEALAEPGPRRSLGDTRVQLPVACVAETADESQTGYVWQGECLGPGTHTPSCQQAWLLFTYLDSWTSGFLEMGLLTAWQLLSPVGLVMSV